MPSSSYGSSSSSSKKPKGSGGRSIGGFFGNLIGGIGEMATGFFPGMYHIGASALHDAGHAVGLTGGQYQLDDIGKGIWDAYSAPGTFWGEAVRANTSLLTGDLSGYWNHGKRSWSSFYDDPAGPLLDIASLVTGGAGVAAKGAGLAARSAEAGSAARLAWAKRAGLDADTLEPYARTITARDGNSFAQSFSTNPVIRTRQRAYDAVSQRFPEAPGIGAQRRYNRNLARVERQKAARERSKVLNPVVTKIGGLKRDERTLASILAGGHDPKAYLAFVRNRIAAIQDEIAKKNEAGVSRWRDDEHVNQLSLDDAGNARRADTQDSLAWDEALPEDLTRADRMDNLKVNNRNLARLRKREAEVVRVVDKKWDAKDLARVREVVDSVKGLSEYTTGLLKSVEKQTDEGALSRSYLESRLMQMTGAVDGEYAGAIRSHVRVRPDKIEGAHNRATRFSKPGELAHMKRNTGYAFWNGLDEMNPAMFVHAAKQTMEYAHRKRRFEDLAATAMKVDEMEAEALIRSGEWVALKPTSQEAKAIDTIYATMVDAEDVFSGLPGYGSMVSALRTGLVTEPGKVALIPKSLHSELIGEFNQAHKFIRMWVDKPTRIWRALTLNLRPAWIANNYVGQMLLLATAYGVRGLKEYVLQFSLPGRAAKKYDPFMDLAPELSDFGWAHEAHLAVRDLRGNKVTRGMRRLSDFMGDLNQRLTDDHTRRAAFNAEIRPHVKRYMKEHPGVSFEDAAKELWKNEQFADEVTRRVLDNMVDFTDLSNFERSIIKRAIPFYAWIRGITKRTGQLVANEPWKAAIGANVGAIGIQANEEKYGSLPEFLQGIIGNGGNNVLVTQGLNPFMTPADVAGMVGGLFVPGQMGGPQNPLATMNPILKVPFEAAANQDFFYGRPVIDPEREGESSFAERYWKQAKQSLAQYRVWNQYQMEQAAKRGELEYDPLFEPSLKNAVLSYLGLPIRTMDVDLARQRGLDG